MLGPVLVVQLAVGVRKLLNSWFLPPSSDNLFSISGRERLSHDIPSFFHHNSKLHMLCFKYPTLLWISRMPLKKRLSFPVSMAFRVKTLNTFLKPVYSFLHVNLSAKCCSACPADRPRWRSVWGCACAVRGVLIGPKFFTQPGKPKVISSLFQWTLSK